MFANSSSVNWQGSKQRQEEALQPNSSFLPHLKRTAARPGIRTNRSSFREMV